ncbi:hypothetical protein AGMMS49574_18130 [Bacteroidia bacterium]|nr:hypothetical protein AGMMS49574_18130 [Bacteroidia bacterium]
MKNTFIYLISILLVGLAACTEDFNKDVAPPQSNEQEMAKSASVQLVAGSDLASPLVLGDLDEEALINVIKVSQAPAAVTEGATLSFVLEILPIHLYDDIWPTKTSVISTPIPSVTVGNGASVTVRDLDKILKTMFGKAPNPNSVMFNIITTVYIHIGTSTIKTEANHVGPITASVIPVEASATLYVPGNHQGWNPATAPQLYSENSDFVYDGFLWLDGEYKFTSAPDWDHDNYGVTAYDKLDPTGGNLKADPGFYHLKADLNTLTYQQTLTEWGIIGDATPKGWDASTPMTYDKALNEWVVTAPLEGGKEFKFRANDSWDINFGGTPEKLELNGGNIKIERSNVYTIKLRLSNGLFNSFQLIENLPD